MPNSRASAGVREEEEEEEEAGVVVVIILVFTAAVSYLLLCSALSRICISRCCIMWADCFNGPVAGRRW